MIMKTCWQLKLTILISVRFLQLRAVDSSFVHFTHSVCFRGFLRFCAKRILSEVIGYWKYNGFLGFGHDTLLNIRKLINVNWNHDSTQLKISLSEAISTVLRYRVTDLFQYVTRPKIPNILFGTPPCYIRLIWPPNFSRLAFRRSL